MPKQRPHGFRNRRDVRWGRGISAIETLATMAITCVTLGVALPGLGELQERQRLYAMSALVETDLQHARSLAVARNEVLRLSFADDGAGGCYVLHTGTAQQCSCGDVPGAAACSGGAEALRVASLAGTGGMRLQTNTSTIAFSPTTGTVTPTGTLRLQTSRGETVRLVVNVMGRVRSCSPDGLPGYRLC